MANYHPANELLMKFAAGQLPNALGIMVACHLEECEKCRRQASVYDQVGGELLAEQESVDMHSTAQDVWKFIQAYQDKKEAAIKLPNLPKPLQRFVPNNYDELPWNGFSKSIQSWDLPISDSQYTARFYKIAAGKELPEHTHKGNEFTLVMSGSFSDKAGDYHEGDFILADQQTQHQPRAHMDQDCICFAVMDAPLKLKGWMGWFVNPFLR